MRRIDPATLQAGLRAIADELHAVLKANGCGKARVKIEFFPTSLWPFEIWLHDLPIETGRTCEWVKAETFEEAVGKARDLVAGMRHIPWTHEDIGRTLGVIEEPQP